jgi:tetratricopeptide (TPR) repeat protein
VNTVEQTHRYIPQRLVESVGGAHTALVTSFCLLALTASGWAFGQAPPIKTLNPASQGSVQPKESRGIAPEPDPVLERAKASADRGMVTDAERDVRQYLETHPGSADGHFLLGYILFREIQEQAAVRGASGASYAERSTGADSKETKAKASLAEYTEGAKHHAPSAADLRIVALDYVILGDYPDADRWLTKMLEWNPNDAEGWYYLGRTKYNENRFDEAVRAFHQSLKLDPKNVKAEDNLGLSYAGLDRTDDAITAYQTAIGWQKDAPTKNPGPFINMASLLLDQNRTAESVMYLKQAIEISPQESKSHELLGKAYSRLDQLAEAQSELEKAVELAPRNPNLPCMLGPLYRKQGLFDKAKLERDRCAALNGTHSSPETSRP